MPHTFFRFLSEAEGLPPLRLPDFRGLVDREFNDVLYRQSQVNPDDTAIIYRLVFLSGFLKALFQLHRVTQRTSELHRATLRSGTNRASTV
jgi:hypothetical protein